ncbi:hypothetical protein AB1Y20_019090 [Prymnesium parvum]|uniref:BLOC-1-related complex subunit 5 n=1 Tax=Prymnesium parvum TaxID=97485 RepID=A0AB34JQH0_PRYPA
MGRTPLSRKSSEPSKRKTVGASAALEGVKKSIARKRRSLLEISSAVTSGLMHASQPYEDYVPAEVPDYIPFEPPPDFYAASPCATQKALDSEVKQIAPHATALIGEVAARMRQNVCEASAKGKLAVVTAATRLKENVLDGVEEVKASVRDASKIQWKSEIKKEVFMLQSSASTATTDSLIDGSTVAIGQVGD